MTPFKLELTSKRRAVTVQEKERALQMAQAVSSEDSFMVIMQPSHVYKVFYMVFVSLEFSFFLSFSVSNFLILCVKRFLFFGKMAVNAFGVVEETSSSEKQKFDTKM